jgi:hypothetical protein
MRGIKEAGLPSFDRHACWTNKNRHEINASFKKPTILISKKTVGDLYLNNEIFERRGDSYFSLDRYIEVK